MVCATQIMRKRYGTVDLGVWDLHSDVADAVESRLAASSNAVKRSTSFPRGDKLQLRHSA